MDELRNVTLSFKVKKQLKAALKEIANNQNRTVSNLVQTILSEYIKNEEKK